ncbi:hypothetical protein DICTH_0352 [Dictyoglomus thermophilum H-6-12]|uniref:Uncharacterized protein n=1 Tax=Dictyoglomus thermophilum (strain ATCC 35947 / DSM 3960 / H-6-12) TaxID=309799 RepID=B5YCH6_DICT6|nr:hypothetical protein DICTH_0352 [Dictyoglomus thermophilum H-6-12]
MISRSGKDKDHYSYEDRIKLYYYMKEKKIETREENKKEDNS